MKESSPGIESETRESAVKRRHIEMYGAEITNSGLTAGTSGEVWEQCAGGIGVMDVTEEVEV